MLLVEQIHSIGLANVVVVGLVRMLKQREFTILLKSDWFELGHKMLKDGRI